MNRKLQGSKLGFNGPRVQTLIFRDHHQCQIPVTGHLVSSYHQPAQIFPVPKIPLLLCTSQDLQVSLFQYFKIHMDGQLFIMNVVKQSKINGLHFTLFYFTNCSQPSEKPQLNCKHDEMCFINIVQNLPDANNHAPEVHIWENPCVTTQMIL